MTPLDTASRILGGYLHQDWTDEFAEAEDAVAAIVAEEPHDERVAAATEIEGLLAVDIDDTTLARITTDNLGACFDPLSAGLTHREWLARVAKQLRKA